MSSAIDKSNRKFSVCGSLPNWLPSRSDLTLGTNWAKPATVLGRRTQGCRSCLLG